MTQLKDIVVVRIEASHSASTCAVHNHLSHTIKRAVRSQLSRQSAKEQHLWVSPLSPTAGRSQYILYNIECVIHERSVVYAALSSRRRRHTLSEGKQRAHISHVLQTFKQRYQVQQFVVCRVANPAFDGDGVVCVDVSSATRRLKQRQAYLRGICSS
jgi:hypothetical protein